MYVVASPCRPFQPFSSLSLTSNLCGVNVQVPAHLQNSWESYYMEILMVTGLLAYIMNYIIGKNKNSRLAQAWFTSHRELLESNFAVVGESPPPLVLDWGWVLSFRTGHETTFYWSIFVVGLRLIQASRNSATNTVLT